ncbi:C39 family peptidase [Paenibacillus sp. HJGM_3]|uniref:C39 family peptidase n=1 Tax=Paenibacillus sp. HJGM_3 TaxID=3379816 RepID=UPI00385E72D2
MVHVWNVTKYSFTLLLIAGLLFSSGVFSVLLYAKISGKDLEWFAQSAPLAPLPATIATPAPQPTLPPPKPQSVLIDAPLVRQLPELPSGCEVTSLTMLLQFAGVNKGKMELVPEMKKDPTPIVWSATGIQSWGNPNVGFVGEITAKGKGFGIFHGPLMELLKHYVPSAIDLTGGSFEALEQQLAAGIPSVVWTTIDYAVPSQWVEWETKQGKVVTTFMEHAVLLVGYDDTNVYVNDPLSGKKSTPINKAAFIQVWEAMGKQALSYQ